MKYKNRITAL